MRLNCRRTITAGALMVIILISCPALHAGTLVVPVHIPADGVVPSGAFDAAGTLHVTFGRGKDGFYTQSRDGGKTFSPPVRINRQERIVTVGGERGPKLAIGTEPSPESEAPQA